MGLRAALAVHPDSGHGAARRLADQVADRLRAAVDHLDLVEADTVAQARALMHDARARGLDVLVVLGTSMAWALSAAVTVLGSDQHTYFEAGAAVITLVLLGKLLEARAKAGTSAALEGLIRLQPKTARMLRDGLPIEVDLSEVSVGQRFIVRAGESIPVDGIVREGLSSVDESMLTGESRAIAKAPGSRVYAGTLNQEGMLTCEATISWPKRTISPWRRAAALSSTR